MLIFTVYSVLESYRAKSPKSPEVTLIFGWKNLASSFKLTQNKNSDLNSKWFGSYGTPKCGSPFCLCAQMLQDTFQPISKTFYWNTVETSELVYGVSTSERASKSLSTQQGGLGNLGVLIWNDSYRVFWMSVDHTLLSCLIVQGPIS